jgi:hypothetical protein
VVVDYDGSNTNLTDLDISSQNAVGYILINNNDVVGDNGNNGAAGYTANFDWSSQTTQLNCLYGGNAPSNNGTMQNVTSLNGSSSQLVRVYLNNVAASVGNPGVVTLPVSGTTCSAGNQTTNCGSQIVVCSATLTNPISWFVCPVISSIQDIMASIGKTIDSYLTIPITYFNASSETGQPMYEAWNSVRDIALSILAIVALVMVFSQALSVGPFDAYTVKKILPRLLIAAILITLSWPLIGLMIGLSNGIGNGVRYLIYAPFHNLPAVNFSGGDEALVGGLGIGSALGLFGTLTLGIMAALALFTGLVIIVLRQIVVVLLAILAPIALVLYILPGTEKAWKIWWNSFWGALIMFPLIEAMIAIGSVFSKIAMAAGSTGILDKVIAYMAIYMPYFLLPMTVRFAGGMMQAVGGKVAQVGHGVQGGLSKRRKAAVASNIQRNRNYGFTKGTNKVSTGLRNATGALFAGPRGWMPGSSGAGVRGQNKEVSRAEWVKGNAALQASGQNDRVAIGWAVDHGSDTDANGFAAEKYNDALKKAGTDQDKIDQAKKDYQEDKGAIGRAKGYGLYTQFGQETALELAGKAGGLKRTPKQIRDAAQRIAGGKKNFKYENMLGTFEHNTKDNRGTFYGGLIKPVSGDPVTAGRENAAQIRENWYGSDLGTQLDGRPEIMEQYIRHFQSELNLTGDDEPDENIRASRSAVALVALNEIEEGARAGVGSNNVTIDTEFSKPEFQQARVTATKTLQDRIHSRTADNSYIDFGPRAKPPTPPVTTTPVVRSEPLVTTTPVVRPEPLVTTTPVVRSEPLVTTTTVELPAQQEATIYTHDTNVPTYQRSRSPAYPAPTTSPAASTTYPVPTTSPAASTTSPAASTTSPAASTYPEPPEVTVDELIRRVARPPTKPNQLPRS